MSFIPPAVRANTKWRNVRDYGAVGDGRTDDTAAIALCVSADKTGVVYFPKGIYLASQIDVTHTRGLTLRGDGGVSGGDRTASQIRFTGTGSLIRAGASQGLKVIGLQLLNLGTLTAFIDLSLLSPGAYATQWKVQDVMFNGMASGIGLKIDDSFTGAVSDCHFVFLDTAIHCAADDEAKGCNGLTVGPRNLFQAQNLVHIRGLGGGVTITGNTFQQLANQKAGMLKTTASQIWNMGISITGNWAGDVSDLTGSVAQITLFAKGATIQGNHLATIGIDLLDGCEGVVASGNTIYTGNVIGIRIGSVTDCVTAPNYYNGSNPTS